MRIAIVEDEPVAQEKLISCLRSAAPEATVVACLNSVGEATEWFSKNNAPDLLFCDIQLTDGLSFEIFRATRVGCPVVFTTAFDEYLLEAFQTNGIDYLLKPLKPAHVAAAIGKYRALAAHFGAEYAARLRNVIDDRAKPRDRFLVRKGQSYEVIQTSDIAYFYTAEKLVFLVTKSGRRHLADKPLCVIEEELDPAEFFRANRAWLVHVRAIVRCCPYGKGKLVLELQPPSPEPVVVSQERAAACRNWMGA